MQIINIKLETDISYCRLKSGKNYSVRFKSKEKIVINKKVLKRMS